jgi:mannosyltransferase OCH1-like enzyme
VKQWIFLGNALLLSQPGHPFWLGALEYMLARPPATPVLHHTGPFALGSYYESLAVKPRAKIFGPEIFDNERAVEGVGESRYGYHVRCATWQQPSAEV